MEEAFEGRRRAAVPAESIDAADVPRVLWKITGGDGYSLSSWLAEHGTRWHADELAIHRSGYQL